MGEMHAEITIDRSANDVWIVVGNFGDMEWAGVESCELVGDTRVIGANGRRIVERLYATDDDARVLTYGIVDGDMELDFHRATVRVTPAGKGALVTYDVEADDDLMEMMKTNYPAMLAMLKEHVEES